MCLVCVFRFQRDWENCVQFSVIVCFCSILSFVPKYHVLRKSLQFPLFICLCALRTYLLSPKYVVLLLCMCLFFFLVCTPPFRGFCLNIYRFIFYVYIDYVLFFCICYFVATGVVETEIWSIDSLKCVGVFFVVGFFVRLNV